MRRDPRDDEIRAGLERLGPELDRWVAAAPPAALVARTLARAREELASLPATRPNPAAVPAGFKRELARLLVMTVPALALVLGWNALVLLHVPDVLSTWLPSGLALGLAVAYVVGAVGWTSLVYGSLPIVAHRRAAHRLQETSA